MFGLTATGVGTDPVIRGRKAGGRFHLAAGLYGYAVSGSSKMAVGCLSPGVGVRQSCASGKAELGVAELKAPV